MSITDRDKDANSSSAEESFEAGTSPATPKRARKIKAGRPAAKQRTPAAMLRRCVLLAALLFFTLSLLALTLWRGSTVFIDYRLLEFSRQNSRQAIDRLVSFLEARLMALRHLAQYCAHSNDVRESEFAGFSTALMADVPGILAVMMTDTKGIPVWTAPPDTLTRAHAFRLTSDPKLNLARERSLALFQPAVTESLDIPEHGTGFLVAMPILHGRRASGYVVGVFTYQDLLNSILQPELVQRFRVGVEHAGRPVFPVIGERRSGPGNIDTNVSPLLVRQVVFLGGQDWIISIEPIKNDQTSPLNFASITILALGLTLSLLISLMAFHQMRQSTLLQIEARDSRRRLEDTGISLVEVKAELDLILNSVDEGIILYDTNLQPIQANAAFLTLFGITDVGLAQTTSGRHHENLVKLTGSETRYWALFKALQKHPEQIWTDELEIGPGREGKEPKRIFLRRATTIIGAGGERRGLLVIYKEVTTMKAIERAKDDFLANVTHELRSPLAAVKGFAEMLRRNPNVPRATQDEFIGIICEEAERLQNLIEELLDLRRMEAHGIPLKIAPYDLRVLAMELASGAKSMLLSKNISLRVEWGGSEDSRLKGDVSQIGRALRNLIVNAIKYSPEGGEIVMRGHCGQKQVWIEFSDQGAGIAEADLPHIFDKFYRGASQGKQKGTGLGLAIVKHIVELHGGHLGVRSEVGAGTTFHLELPRSFQPPSQAMLQPADGVEVGASA